MSQADDLNQSRRRYSYLICGAIFLAYIMVYFHRVCPSVIALEMQASFAVGSTLLGLLGSAYFYPYGLMQLPVGLLADSWGPRRTVTASLILAAGGSVLMGLTSDLSWAIVGRVLVGLGVSTVFVSNFKILAEWFDPRKFVMVGGVFMAMGGVGALVASSPLAEVSTMIGWRWTLILVGLLTLFMAVAVWVVVRDRPSEKGWPDLRQDSRPGSANKAALWLGIKEVITCKRFWPISIWACFTTGITFAVGGMWSVPFLQHVYEMSKAEASVYQTTFGISLIIGSPIQSWLANWLGRKPVLIGCSLLFMAVFACFYLFTQSLPPWAIYVLFFCLFLAGGGPGPVIATVSKELFHPAIAGTSVGMVNFFPFFGGGVFQVIIGAVLAAGGVAAEAYTPMAYQKAFGLCFLGAVVSLIAGFLLTETLPEKAKNKHYQD